MRPPIFEKVRVRIGFATAAIGGLASIGGSLIGAGAAKDAAKKAGRIADSQQRLAFYTGQVAREDTAPWRFAGNSAINQITALLGLGYIPSEAYQRPSSTIRGGTDIFDEWIPKHGSTGVPGPVGGASGGGGMGADDLAARRAAQEEAFSLFQTDPGYGFRFGEGLNALDRSAAARGLLLSGPQVKAAERFGQGMASQEYGNWLSRLFTVAGFGPQAINTSTGAIQTAQSQGQQAALAGANARASGYTGAAGAINQGITNALASIFAQNAQGWGDPFGSGSSPTMPHETGFGGFT